VRQVRELELSQAAMLAKLEAQQTLTDQLRNYLLPTDHIQKLKS